MEDFTSRKRVNKLSYHSFIFHSRLKRVWQSIRELKFNWSFKELYFRLTGHFGPCQGLGYVGLEDKVTSVHVSLQVRQFLHWNSERCCTVNLKFCENIKAG